MRELEDFAPFVGFLQLYREQVVEEPVRGRMDVIHHIFHQTYPEVKLENWEEFMDYVKDFNDLCGQALEVHFELNEVRVPVLVNVMWNRVSMLENAIKGNSNLPHTPAVVKNVPVQDDLALSLENLLKTPFVSCPQIWGRDFDLSYERLDGLLRANTTFSILMKEKIRLKTEIKLGSVVCEDANHCNILSNALFGKSGSNAKSTNIDQKLAHGILQQSKHFLSSEAYKCSQAKTHFLPIFNSNTDLYLGDCSYLDTCHKLKSCRYLHYFTLKPSSNFQPLPASERLQRSSYVDHDFTIGDCFTEFSRKITPPQWINCDIRELPFTILGKFAAIVADPAWDIHMSLPYGTWKDLELLTLPMHELQDEGIILLWVTGRSLEIGRKALTTWGYKISDEIIWIKLNQLKRTIVTGRTGHWLNHSKEHLLVGLKGNPSWINRKVDIDVIVSGTRETSRKPDEVYDIVDRIVGKHARKLEIFGRDHNVRPGWFTIGNQVTGTTIHEQDVQNRYDEYKESGKS